MPMAGKRQYTFVRLPEIHFTASGFLLKIFDCLSVFVFVSFCSCFSFFFFFFASLHILKSRKKRNIKINNNLRTGRTNTLLCRSFYRLSREKSVKSMLSKNLHQSVPYALNESCLVCK